ncbi:MAG: gamma-glutamyltransferase [Rhodovibrionaceae bacterium]|nr:gamma-glutamyltransferase [Rhodovibrionaceae bacterium]
MTASPSRGAVAAGHPATAECAAAVLREGGNAVDAGLAAAWMACVAEPVLASPGGGGFAMLRAADGAVALHDFFAETPLEKTDRDIDYREVLADFGTATQAFHIGRGTSATPGFVEGLYAVHAQAGSAPMAELIAPAAKAAREGLVLTRFQRFLATVIAPILLASEDSRRVFAPEGDFPAVGHRVTNPGLAGFLDELAANGLESYRAGGIRAAFEAEFAKGGHLTHGNLDAYRVEERAPLSLAFEGARVHLNPPPSAAGTLVACAFAALDDVDRVAAARALDAVDRARREAGSDLSRLLARFGRPAYRGTTHISVVDAEGRACGMTLSNGEGNGEIVGEFGFMLNNMLGEEDLNPGGALAWTEGVRLSSMMCPSVAEAPDGRIFVLGSGGSNRIRSTIFQVLLQLLARGAEVEEAVNAPRLHVEAGQLDFEAFTEVVEEGALRQAFPQHRAWPEPNLFFGGCHVAGVTPAGTFFGAGDHRRAGVFQAV